MLRLAGTIGIVMCLNATPLVAQQSAVFTVSAAAAEVHKAPSTGSPVIGHAARGAALPVTRELGSWVKVSWPAAPDGVGFVHVSGGTVAHGASPEAIHAAAGAAVHAAAQPSPADARSAGAAAGQLPPPGAALYVTPATHVIGIGAEVASGSPVGYGISARHWRHDRFGVQLDASRYAVQPSALYAPVKRVTDYFWLRPYVGAGLAVHRTTGASGVGYQAFGGGEFTFAAVPQVAVSAALVYRSKRATLTELEHGGVGAAVSAHWYIK